MTDFSIRPYRAGDIPALTALWERSFGDERALIEAFFRLLPHMGIGVAAVREESVIGAAYAVTGLELVRPGEDPVPCGYIYAVAVEEQYRRLGAGRALTLAAAELAKERGAALICTLPAEGSLYTWYADILGVTRALDRQLTRVEAGPSLPCAALSTGDYMARREALLGDQPHLRLSAPTLDFQRSLCEVYGGGFFACGGGIAAAYRDGDRCLIRELIVPNGADRQALAAAIAAALGAGGALLHSPAAPGEGSPYIAAPAGSIPPACVWNLSFD